LQGLDDSNFYFVIDSAQKHIRLIAVGTESYLTANLAKEPVKLFSTRVLDMNAEVDGPPDQDPSFGNGLGVGDIEFGDWTITLTRSDWDEDVMLKLRLKPDNPGTFCECLLPEELSLQPLNEEIERLDSTGQLQWRDIGLQDS
jgi:hypothetical protein